MNKRWQGPVFAPAEGGAGGTVAAAGSTAGTGANLLGNGAAASSPNAGTSASGATSGAGLPASPWAETRPAGQKPGQTPGQTPAPNPAQDPAKGSAQDPAKDPAKDPNGAAAAANQGAAPDYSALALPEGIEATQPAFQAFKEAAAQHHLPPAAAQALVDSVGPKLRDALAAPYQAWSETQARWQSEIKAVPHFGGARLEQTLADAGRAMDRFGSPALRQALTATGAGNNPEVVRFVARVGRALAGGSFVGGNPVATKDPLRALYPTMFASGGE